LEKKIFVMPKVNRLNTVVEETPYRRTTVVDPSRRFKGLTQVVQVANQAPTAVKQLRSREIVVYTVEREPQDPATLIRSGVAGDQYYNWITSGVGAQALCNTPGGVQWLKKSLIGHTYLALPEELRNCDQAQQHYHWIIVTRFTVELGFEALDYQYRSFLNGTQEGKQYLAFLLECPHLAALSYWSLESSVIGKIYLDQKNLKNLATFGGRYPWVPPVTYTPTVPILVEEEEGLPFTPYL
jgi:hypothetical protein